MGGIKRKWNSSEKKPSESKYYSLCLLDLGTNLVKGWWNGVYWDGLHYKGEKVLRWKFTI